MADTTTLTTSTSLPWAFQINKDGSAVEPYNITTQTFNATLNTKDTYLDRDIEINLITQSGKFTVTNTTSANPPIIEDAYSILPDNDIKNRAIAASVSTVAPADGAFLALYAKATAATATITTQVTTSGYLKAGTVDTSEVAIEVPKANTVFIPLVGTTITVSLTDTSEGSTQGLGKYLTKYAETPKEGDTEAVKVEAVATPKGTGYVSEGSSTTATTYWKVKKGTFTTYTNSKDVNTLTDYGASILAVRGLPSGGGLRISAGWYEDGYMSLADLVPDDANIELTAGAESSDKIAAGYKAYDKDGKLIEGKLADIVAAAGGNTAWGAYYHAIDETQNSGYGIIRADTYTNSAYAINAADVSKTITITGEITPTITTVLTTTSTTNAKNVTSNDVNALSSTIPNEGYYVAVQTQETTTTNVSAILPVITPGWIEKVNLERTATTTAVTAKASNPYYLKLATGGITASNSITEKPSVESKITIQNMTSQQEKAISSDKYDSENGFKYGFIFTNTAEKGTVTPNYSVTTAGYIEKTEEAVNGLGTEVDVNVKTPTLQKYIKAGTADIRAALTSNSSTQYFTTVTDGTQGDITATFDKFTINDGLFLAPTGQNGTYQSNYGTTQQYKIITGEFAYDTVTLSSAEWNELGDNVSATTFTSGTNNSPSIAFVTSTEGSQGKNFRQIDAITTITANATLSGIASIGKAGWFEAGRKVTISGNPTNTYTSSASIFIEVFNGAYTINNNTVN